MKKIRFKVPRHEVKEWTEVDEILSESARSYEHISVAQLDFESGQIPDFFKKPYVWKSIKINRINFATVQDFANFMKVIAEDLEEAEIEMVAIPTKYAGLVPIVGKIPSVEFRKLQKLKCGSDSLHFHFVCSTLQVLRLNFENKREQPMELLRLNPKLEELHFDYESIRHMFVQRFADNGVNLQLNKLHVRKVLSMHRPEYSISSPNCENFESFLRSQKDCLEELLLEWYEGRLPERNEFYYVQDDDVFVRAMKLVFREMTGLRKLIVADKLQFLNNDFCHSVRNLELTPNNNITELRVRFRNTVQSNATFIKLIRACPKLKHLSAHELNQQLLKACADHLPDLESIFTLSLKVDTLPAEDFKFEKLHVINFYECTVENHPEMSELKLSEKKAAVLRMLT